MSRNIIANINHYSMIRGANILLKRGFLSLGPGALLGPGRLLTGPVERVGVCSQLKFFRQQSTATTSTTTTTSTTPQVTIKRPVTIDRELPDPFESKKRNRRYFVTYGLGVTLACLIIFNYEKTRSPVINSVLYCLRRSDNAKKYLGANISFKSSWPWIWGTLNTMKGDVDIEFAVKGDINEGMLKLRATREDKLHPFDVHEWKLQIQDGPELDLLNDPTVKFGL